MSASDSGSNVRDSLRAAMAAATATQQALVDNILARAAAKWSWNKAPTDAAASTAYRIALDASLDFQTLISECKVVANTTVASDPANYATIALVYNDGAGGADTTIATLDTSATALTAKVARSMAVTAANQVVPAGKQLEIVITKAGTGVALPSVSAIVKGYPQ